MTDCIAPLGSHGISRWRTWTGIEFVKLTASGNDRH